MKKSYFLLYGSSLLAKTLMASMEKRFSIEFELHDSSYVGEYYKYSGLYADKMTIELNKAGPNEFYKEEAYMEFPTLIYISITSGRNRDKKSKLRYLKRCLDEIDNVWLLRETELDEP